MSRRHGVAAALVAVAFVLYLGAWLCLAADGPAQGAAGEVTQLIAQLEDGDPIAAGEAARRLGEIGEFGDIGDVGIRALIDGLDDERGVSDLGVPRGRWCVADGCVGALRCIKKPQVVPPLCNFLEESKGSKERIRALEVLHSLGPIAKKALPHVLKFTGDPDPEVRGHVVYVLWEIAPPAEQATSVFRESLADKNADVVGAAVQGLGALGGRASEAVEELVPLLDDTRECLYFGGFDVLPRVTIPLRAEVAMTLGKISSIPGSAIPKLRKMLNSHHECDVVAAAFAICRATGRPDPGLPILLATLRRVEQQPLLAPHRTEEVRMAADALSHLAYGVFRTTVLDGLLTALKHPDDWVRLSSLEAMMAINPPDILTILRRMVHDSDSGVRWRALDAMVQHVSRHPNLIELYIDELNRAASGEETGNDASARLEVIRLLIKIGPDAQPAVPVLRELVNDSNARNVRRAALKAIRQIGGTAKKTGSIRDGCQRRQAVRRREAVRGRGGHRHARRNGLLPPRRHFALSAAKAGRWRGVRRMQARGHRGCGTGRARDEGVWHPERWFAKMRLRDTRRTCCAILRVHLD